jgi:hypothetical protein
MVLSIHIPKLKKLPTLKSGKLFIDDEIFNYILIDSSVTDKLPYNHIESVLLTNRLQLQVLLQS